MYAIYVWIFNKMENCFHNFLKHSCDRLSIRVVKFIAFYYPDAKIRKLYLRRLGFIMDEGTFSNLGLKFTMNDDFSPCVFVAKRVSIAPNVTFIANSEPNNSLLLAQNSYVKEKLIKKNTKIIVEDDVWIGANVTIMPGVRLRRGCIIGAGAVLTKDTDEFGVYAGIPAIKIRQLEGFK